MFFIQKHPKLNPSKKNIYFKAKKSFGVCATNLILQYGSYVQNVFYQFYVSQKVTNPFSEKQSEEKNIFFPKIFAFFLIYEDFHRGFCLVRSFFTIAELCFWKKNEKKNSPFSTFLPLPRKPSVKKKLGKKYFLSHFFLLFFNLWDYPPWFLCGKINLHNCITLFLQKKWKCWHFSSRGDDLRDKCLTFFFSPKNVTKSDWTVH